MIKLQIVKVWICQGPNCWLNRQ